MDVKPQGGGQMLTRSQKDGGQGRMESRSTVRFDNTVTWSVTVRSDKTAEGKNFGCITSLDMGAHEWLYIKIVFVELYSKNNQSSFFYGQTSIIFTESFTEKSCCFFLIYTSFNGQSSVSSARGLGIWVSFMNYNKVIWLHMRTCTAQRSLSFSHCRKKWEGVFSFITELLFFFKKKNAVKSAKKKASCWQSSDT